jgi:hypothetical protein
MSEPGASPGAMPGSPFPGRPGPDLDELLLDMILNGQPLPPDAPEEMYAVAEMLSSLPGPAEPGRLPGETAARLAFARAAAPVSVSRGARPRARRRQSWVSATLVAAAVGLGCAAAAYAGALPGPILVAFHAIGAPPARATLGARQSAEGLCNAYQHALTYGPAQAEAIALQKLERAAGGTGKIDAYCATPQWHTAGPARPAVPRAARPKPPWGTKPSPPPTPAPARGAEASRAAAPAPVPNPGPAPAPSTPTVTPAPTAAATLTPTPALTRTSAMHGTTS